MNTSLTSVIRLLEVLREEVGGDVPVRVQDPTTKTPIVLSNIEIVEKLIISGHDERRVKEVVFVPYQL